MEKKYYRELMTIYEERIDKAIEELSYMSTDAYTDNYDIRDKHYKLLMNILKGDEINDSKRKNIN